LIEIELQDDQDSIDLTPKKAAWDLKRDIEPKLSVLEKRTHRAILKLLKDKLDTQQMEEEES